MKQAVWLGAKDGGTLAAWITALSFSGGCVGFMLEAIWAGQWFAPLWLIPAAGYVVLARWLWPKVKVVLRGIATGWREWE